MTSPTTPRTASRMPGSGYRPTIWLAAIAAVTVLAGIGILLALREDSGPAGAPLELSLPASDASASCLPVDAELLADMSPAFAGTATGVEDGTVTLDVDRWYAGGDADTVELQAASGMEALIAGFEFEVGQRYLITAGDGVVNFCGFSGPAGPELTNLFDQAFTAG